MIPDPTQERIATAIERWFDGPFSRRRESDATATVEFRWLAEEVIPDPERRRLAAEVCDSSALYLSGYHEGSDNDERVVAWSRVVKAIWNVTDELTEHDQGILKLAVYAVGNRWDELVPYLPDSPIKPQWIQSLLAVDSPSELNRRINIVRGRFEIATAQDTENLERWVSCVYIIAVELGILSFGSDDARARIDPVWLPDEIRTHSDALDAAYTDVARTIAYGLDNSETLRQMVWMTLRLSTTMKKFPELSEIVAILAAGYLVSSGTNDVETTAADSERFSHPDSIAQLRAYCPEPLKLLVAGRIVCRRRYFDLDDTQHPLRTVLEKLSESATDALRALTSATRVLASADNMGPSISMYPIILGAQSSVPVLLRLEQGTKAVSALLHTWRIQSRPALVADLYTGEARREPVDYWSLPQAIAYILSDLFLSNSRSTPASNLRHAFVEYCLGRFRRSRKRRGENSTEVLHGWDPDRIEPSPMWRTAYVRALAELEGNPKGQVYRTLEAMANQDTSDCVRDEARTALDRIAQIEGNYSDISPRRAMMHAWFELRKAHMKEVGAVIDEVGALMVREQEIREGSAPE